MFAKNGSYSWQAAQVLRTILFAGIVAGSAPSPQHLIAQARLAPGTSAPGGTTDRTEPPPSPNVSVNLKRAEIYLIGPGDVLAINVWKDAEISRTMPVRPDGRISLPLVGEIQAAGFTAAQLQEHIVERLAGYMTQPEVNVIVQEIKSRSFNIVGKVNKPGAYALTRPMTVLDAIAEAGGFQDFARLTKVYVLRSTASGSTQMLPFNYKQVIKGHSLDQNVQLQPEDSIVVP
ncbi:MAG: polysaccharide biosynthesis/export family protein [Terracidiphilus sp.]|jgi:polysaccharide export outer membrane protein